MIKTYYDWYQALYYGEYAIADVEIRNQIMAAMELNLLLMYRDCPLFSPITAQLYSMKINYPTYTEVFEVGFGGIRRMTYNFTDAEWVPDTMPLQSGWRALQGRACVQTHFCDELLSQRSGCEDSLPIVGTCGCEHHIQHLCAFIRRWIRRNVRCACVGACERGALALTGESTSLDLPSVDKRRLR